MSPRLKPDDEANLHGLIVSASLVTVMAVIALAFYLARSLP